jgi:predicted transcriptional regulator
MTLPTPDELATQYKAGQIELEAAFLLLLEHVRLLYQLKEVDILVLNGLLQDVQLIAEELKLERPSAAMRLRLLEWVRQIEDAVEARANPEK